MRVEEQCFGLKADIFLSRFRFWSIFTSPPELVLSKTTGKSNRVCPAASRLEMATCLTEKLLYLPKEKTGRA